MIPLTRCLPDADTASNDHGTEPHTRSRKSSRKTGRVTSRGREERTRGSHVIRWAVSAALGVVVVLGVGAFSVATPAASAAEPSPWWHLTSGSRPTDLPAEAGAKGEIVLTAANVGDAVADGAAPTPIVIEDHLPAGLKVRSVEGFAGGIVKQERGLVECQKIPLRCTFGAGPKGSLPPYDQIEIRIRVESLEPHSGEPNEATITGGGAPPAQISRPIMIAAEGVATPFGIEAYEFQNEEVGGAPAHQAGSHPFQQTTTIDLNQAPAKGSGRGDLYEASDAALPKDVHLHWPAGLLGNPSPGAKCTLAQFLTFVQPPEQSGEGLDPTNACPSSSAIGVSMISIDEPVSVNEASVTVPIFNLTPSVGEPARFGFLVNLAAIPVLIDPALRSGNGEDEGIDVSVTNISQVASLLSAKATVWGVPGDPRHDNSRGWACLYESRGLADGPCEPAAEEHPSAFLTLPTSCSGAPLQSSMTADSWVEPQNSIAPVPVDPAMPALDGCNRLPFAPAIHSEPTSDAATTGTGLGFDLDFHDEGLLNSEGLAQSQMKKAVVTLPEGFTANPSLAEGLKACSQSEYEAATTRLGTGCNDESKIGEVEIESPLVEGKKVTGGLYVATQGQNPYHNLLTIYLIARNEELGILVRQALKVAPNPVTGQLTTEVDDVPQLPFSHFQLSFRSGQRSPLITPPACGTYAVKAALYPWSNPGAGVERESAFQITSGPEGLGCPSGGVPPFHPVLEAGTINNAAGTYSPFYTHITRKDSEQEITRFSIKLPTGLLAKLKGVSECSDAGIAAAKAREHEGGGAEEEAHPSCPANSEVGHSLVGAGVGNVLAYTGGKLYLAGPYQGSPLSLVSVTAAKVGPFDLGTVVVRFAIDINHETAEVSIDGANSDPIPHIVDGIPIHLRDIRAYVDRPGFTLNPTSCAKKSTASTILGSGANFASSADDVPVTVSSPFQAADCASLGFAPKLALNLTGKKTHRGALPAFKAVLTYPKEGAYANIAKAQVTLPKSEFLEQGHLKNVCTRKVFETGRNPGENCPANSIYGNARATTPLLEQPLEGPVYLRTGYGTKLPELAAALNGPQISITLAGRIDSVHIKGVEGSRIRNSFEMVPDAPVEKFTLELKGGKKGLLVNSTDVCKGTHKALAAFTGQNGKLDEYEPALKAQCGKGGGKKSGGKKKTGK
jgi:hypothetical protein